MPRFFVEEIPEGFYSILGPDAKHIAKSLRMKAGEPLTLCDKKGYDYLCIIERIDGDCVQVRVTARRPSIGEPCCKVRLFQAMPKGDKLEMIVQKATELGVDEVVPVITDRCISRPNSRGMEKKQQRLQKIACEAAKQSERGKIPAILDIMSFQEALTSMKESELAILFYEEATNPLHQILSDTPSTLAIMVGSEGGFAGREAKLAQENGIHLAKLGNRILRCETAPLCALAAIMYHLGEY